MHTLTNQHSVSSASNEPWQIRMARRSFKKREKLHILKQLLYPIPDDWRCLDLGCARGSLSYFLRQWGGRWVSVDLDQDNVQSTLQLVRHGVVQVGPGLLPFRPATFDLVVSMDFLEHVQDDDAVFDEMVRLVKPGGLLVIGTPTTGRGLVLNRLKPRLGLTLEHYGHVREGYHPDDLVRGMEQRGLRVFKVNTYARFLTESVELFLNALYIRKQKRSEPPVQRRDGVIAPATEQEFRRISGTFKIYQKIYPIIWAFTRLDCLIAPLSRIPFFRGYAVIVAGRKTGNLSDPPVERS